MNPSENGQNLEKQASSPSLLVTRVVPIMIGLQILLTLLVYAFLPNTIPSHWNETGQIDSYEAKWVFVGFLPVLSILLYIFVLVLLTFVLQKSGSQDMKARKNEISRSLLMFMMIMQQSIFFITQVILLIFALRSGSGATH